MIDKYNIDRLREMVGQQNSMLSVLDRAVKGYGLKVHTFTREDEEDGHLTAYIRDSKIIDQFIKSCEVRFVEISKQLLAELTKNEINK